MNLAPGEQACVEVRLDRADLAYWDLRVDDWILEGGDYRVDVGASSRDIRLSATVTLPGETVDQPLTLQSSLAEIAADPEVLQRFLTLVSGAMPGMGGAGADNGAMAAMMASIPIGRIPAFLAGGITREQLQQIL